MAVGGKIGAVAFHVMLNKSTTSNRNQVLSDLPITFGTIEVSMAKTLCLKSSKRSIIRESWPSVFSSEKKRCHTRITEAAGAVTQKDAVRRKFQWLYTTSKQVRMRMNLSLFWQCRLAFTGQICDSSATTVFSL
jgi:hypothetical protein